MTDIPTASRRGLLRGLAATGLASVAATQAMAQDAPTVGAKTGMAPPLANPQDKYPRPPFDV